MLHHGSEAISISALFGAAALLALLALPCQAQEFSELRAIENAEQIREVTALKWWQSSVSALGVAVGFTHTARRSLGLERRDLVEIDAPQPTIGLRYRISERSSIALNTVFGRAGDRSGVIGDTEVLAQGFSKKTPSFAANLRSGLRFNTDDGFQMNIKLRRSGVRLIVKKDFY